MSGLLRVDGGSVAEHAANGDDGRAEDSDVVEGAGLGEVDAERVVTEPVEHLNNVEDHEHTKDNEEVAPGVLVDHRVNR